MATNTEMLQQILANQAKQQASLDKLASGGVDSTVVKGWVKDALREGTA